MTPSGYALLGLTAIVAVLAATLAFCILRIAAAARETRKHLTSHDPETALLSAALQDAVTRLKAQERAMTARAAASEHLSGQIVESLTAGLLVVNAGGGVEILNPAARRLLDLRDAPLGEPLRTTLHRAIPLAEVIEECRTSGRAVVRRPIRMPGGMPASHLGVTASPLAVAPATTPVLSAAAHTDGVCGVICLFADLTNVVDLEEQLRLKDTLAQLGELTAGIAHEFRNGLATIHGYSRLIDPGLLPVQYGPYVEGIRQETAALGRVVTNFLNFAKPDRVVFGEVDLGALITRAIEEIRLDLPHAHIEVSGQFGVIEGDDVLLRQMIGNLVRNGVDAGMQSGAAPVVHVRGSIDAQDHLCRVVVEDNGPGVSPDLRERVFRPFFTTKPEGTGLGLAIVQKVVVTHNGRITVGTAANGGARFELSFPLAMAGAAHQA